MKCFTGLIQHIRHLAFGNGTYKICAPSLFGYLPNVGDVGYQFGSKIIDKINALLSRQLGQVVPSRYAQRTPSTSVVPATTHLPPGLRLL